MSNWISVKDKLPPTDGEYLTYSTKLMAYNVLTYSQKYKAFNTLSQFSAEDAIMYAIYDVSHWQPLPETPKINEQEKFNPAEVYPLIWQSARFYNSK